MTNVFDSKRQEMIRDLRKFCNVRVGWSVIVTRMVKRVNAYRVLVGKCGGERSPGISKRR